MATIEVDQLSKSYRVYQKKEGLREAIRGLFQRDFKIVEAVRNISLRVEAGEFVAFLGPNGAGKTTTLKLLSGVISPSAGNATVMGYVPWQRKLDYRRRFALVMGQKGALSITQTMKTSLTRSDMVQSSQRMAGKGEPSRCETA